METGRVQRRYRCLIIGVWQGLKHASKAEFLQKCTKIRQHISKTNNVVNTVSFSI